MASGIFALLDDIAALMDDVVLMSKMATKKTAGILGDDLAVNAEKASGFVSSREIPVLWAITKGSFANKLIILPIAFLLSYFLPIAVTVLLICGGLYLAYEGAEKIYSFLFHRKQHQAEAAVDRKSYDTKDLLSLEKQKIKSAILTDFILSVEIVIIALGAVEGQELTVQIVVVSFVAILATIGVYGIVAMLVRMDDIGLHFIKKSNSPQSFLHRLGQGLVWLLPKVVKSLSVIGTIALLLVSGGIFVHKISFFHHILEEIPSIIRDFSIGLGVGIVVFIVLSAFKALYGYFKT